MANDLATLTGYLKTTLRDSTDTTWTVEEKQDLITWSISRLYPNVVKYVTLEKQVDPNASFITTGDVTTPWISIHRIDLWDGDPTSTLSRMVQELPGQAWEVQTQIEGGSAVRIVMNPSYNYNGAYFYMIHGYIAYDSTANLVPDRLIPLVLARARQEAYRRMGADRAQFKNWLVQNQTQNVSVNELVQLINEASNEADGEERRMMTRHPRPVTARR